ncbi:MAG: L,D-transpeptidase [Rhabdochlamydiaceae bacterium]|nr:L,D-transpeptidase [Candidatus Amphrikana amoebophyrae]
MTFRRMLLVMVVLMGAFIGVKAFKKRSTSQSDVKQPEVEQVATKVVEPTPVIVESEPLIKKEISVSSDNSEEVNLIDRLFTTGHDKLPIVETVSYSSRVPWLKGRPAWIADYASHFATSRHFIARSLNKKADYYTQKVSSGDRFNVLNPDKMFNFYLLVDLKESKMWFYYVDAESAEKTLLKTYKVGLGVLTNDTSLTPTGAYLLGEKVATYKPGMLGYFQSEKVEMINVFGTRWLPFESEIADCSDSAKGYGIHGLPIRLDESNNELKEETHLLGQYASDGCIRLKQEDVEELFSIVISRPTIVEIVKDSKEIRADNKKIPQLIAYGKD